MPWIKGERVFESSIRSVIFRNEKQSSRLSFKSSKRQGNCNKIARLELGINTSNKLECDARGPVTPTSSTAPPSTPRFTSLPTLSSFALLTTSSLGRTSSTSTASDVFFQHPCPWCLLNTHPQRKKLFARVRFKDLGPSKDCEKMFRKGSLLIGPQVWVFIINFSLAL